MKGTKILTILALLLMMVLPLGLSGIALAQEENGVSDNVTTTTPPPITTTTPPPPTTTTTEEPPPESVAMSTEFPALEAIATGEFTFTVQIQYQGQTDRIFDLNASAPAGWDIYVTPQYDSQRISSISIDASSFSPTTKTVKVIASPQAFALPEPGDYELVLEAASGEVVGSIDLTARITAKYVLNAVPYNQLYNTKASAGRDNAYSLVITNLGTASIDNITFSSEKPEGWEITFQPDKLDLLNSLDQNTVDVNIKPPPKTVAGDYMITLHVSGTQADAEKMNVRVTVKTPTIWGWVGVFIIVLVVAGLIFTFMRLGRR